MGGGTSSLGMVVLHTGTYHKNRHLSVQEVCVAGAGWVGVVNLVSCDIRQKDG